MLIKPIVSMIVDNTLRLTQQINYSNGSKVLRILCPKTYEILEVRKLK